MNDWDAAAASEREDLLEGLDRAGLTVRSSTLIEGDITCAGTDVAVTITVPEDSPYSPPKVRPLLGEGGLSWHAELDGTLCLWSTEDTGGLPWRTADQVIERVQKWFADEAAGWPDDTPDLDLQRYWKRAPGLMLYPDLDEVLGEVVQFTKSPPTLTVRPSRRRNHKHPGCLILDAGELETPLRTAEQVMDLVDADPNHGQMVRDGSIPVVLVRYWRQGNEGVLGLRATKGEQPTFAAMSTAHQGDATLQLRAGPDRLALEGRRVAIVGLGAIGAQVADLLARAGIRTFTVMDGDIVYPGNLIRHIADESWIGKPKVDAVQAYLAAGPAKPTVKALPHGLTSTVEATDLLQNHDIVIDATADGVATRLLQDGATVLGRAVVSVCLVREGQAARVDRWPLAEGEEHAPPTPPAPRGDRLFDGGCANPISPAPMWAATAAAAHAAGAVVDLLTERNDYPPTLIDVLIIGDGTAGGIGGPT